MKSGKAQLAISLGVCLGSWVLLAHPVQANLINNGGFETPPGVYPYWVFGSGSDLPGWTIESGTVEIVGTYWQAAEGVQSLDLNGIFEEIGTIYQDVPTVAGERYKIRFAYAGNPECGPTTKTTTVFWNGEELATVSFDTTGRSTTDMGWTYYDYEVTASGTSGRLKFQSMTSSFCGPALDDISVTPVHPLPPPPPPPPPPPLGPVPVITSFDPHSAQPGDNVSIVGTNFGETVADNLVYFGAVKAPVQSASPSLLTVLAPTGALFAPITVTVNGLTAYGGSPFGPTFSGNRVIDATAFAPRVTFATGSDPTTLAIGDLDGDGKPDIALVNYQSHALSVFRNTSSAGSIDADSFAPRVDFPAGPSPASVALGDLDGDGRLDIVVANDYGANISVYRNTSSPGDFTTDSLAPRVNFAAGTHPVNVAIGDLDGDGRPDIAVANAAHAPSTVGVFHNVGAAGDITPSSFAPMVEFPVGSYVFKVTIGDLDGDGRPDLAAANIETASVSVLRNISSVGVIASNSFAPHVDFDTAGRTFDLAIGDLDGDGIADLAAVGDGAVSLFRNRGAGPFNADSFEPRVALPIPGTAYEIRLADLGGDAKPDLAVTVLYQDGVSVYENRSSEGSLTGSSFGPKYDYTGAGNSVGVGDVDGDTRPDLVTCLSSVVSVYRNIGGGSAPPPPPPPPPPPTNTVINNGGFEMPPGVYPYMVFGAGLSLPGWTIESGTVEIVGTYWQAAEGSQSLDLNGIFEEIGTIYQELATVPGERYRIRFAYAGNPECGPAVKTTKVIWNGEELATVSFDSTGRSNADMGWTYYEYEVTATGSTGRLKFQSTTSSFCGPALDDVSVTPVNQPPPPPPPPPPTNVVTVVSNGGFEIPGGVYPYQVFGYGYNLPGWTIESGTVEIVGTYWQAAEGSQSLDLNGIFEEIGTIYQDVATVPGQHYKVRFAYAGNPECGPTVAIKSFKVHWNGDEIASLEFDTTGKSTGDIGWQYYECTVIASNATSRLKFKSTSSSFCGPTLDDVSVTSLAPTNPLAAAPPTYPQPSLGLGLGQYPQLTIRGNVGRVYRIECAPDPFGAEWQTLTNIVLPQSPYVWYDLSGSSAPRKFYRAVLVH